MMGAVLSNTVTTILAEYLALEKQTVLDAWERSLSSLSGGPVALDDAALYKRLGTTFELLVGLDLADESYPGLLDYLSERDAHDLLAAIRAHNEPLGDSRIATAAFCLEPARMFHHANPDWTRRERQEWVGSVRRVGEGYARRCKEALAALWSTYLHRGRRMLAALGRQHRVDVVFSQWGHAADLIAGSTVVDIKVSQDPRSHLDEWVDQVLFYALADTADQYGIDQVAIYLGWQGELLTAPLRTFFPTANGATLLDVRRELRAIAADW